MLDTAEAMAPNYDPETRVSLNKFVDQLPSVFNQVILCGLAILDFKRLLVVFKNVKSMLHDNFLLYFCRSL